MFEDKWKVPKEAYLECMEAYLCHETEYGWYLCLDGDNIVGGLGVIVNDYHNRKDLTPNVCAVYTERISRARNRRTFTAYSCSRYEEERDHTTLSDYGSYRFL